MSYIALTLLPIALLALTILQTQSMLLLISLLLTHNLFLAGWRSTDGFGTGDASSWGCSGG
jgi:hypothetical protein